MLRDIRPALTLAVAMTVLTGLLYPLAITGIAQIAFPFQANGSLVRSGNTVVGSALIGQSFASARYFHGRPSATQPPYNAAASTGSNLGPTSKALAERVRGEVAAIRAREGATGAVPADLATTSGSGLDPEISPAAALLQLPRVARARNLPDSRLRELIAGATEERTLGILGEPRVNVLELNLALDGEQS